MPSEVTPLYGNDNNNTLYLNYASHLAGYDTIVFANGGDDVIVRDRTGGYHWSNSGFNDGFIFGGAGNDVVSYAAWHTSISVNLAAGSGSIDGTSFGTDFYDSVEGVVGSSAGDHIIGNGVANRIWGHDGADALWGEDGNDMVRGGIGNDIVYGGSGADSLYGDNGHDTVAGGSGNDVVHGGSGNDTLRGDGNNDVLYGEGGNDVIEGGSGDDTLSGGDGADHLDGGSGHDTIVVTGSGGDVIQGGTGVDEAIFVDPVVVNLLGGTVARGAYLDSIAGIENVVTGSGADTVFGSAGTNMIRTLGGADVVYAVGGDDTIMLGSGADRAIGGAGDERMWGESGDDWLIGGGGEDELRGGANADRIQGGTGSDEMWGESGADTFEWRDGDVNGTGPDVVHDFVLGVDMIAFGPGFLEGQDMPGFSVDSALHVVGSGGDALLYAFVDDIGLQYVARFENVSAAGMLQRIANGTIFDSEVSSVGGDMPDGLFG